MAGQANHNQSASVLKSAYRRTLLLVGEVDELAPLTSITPTTTLNLIVHI